MTPTPGPVVILVPFEVGSPKEARRVKPVYPGSAKTKPPPGPPFQPIPDAQRRAMVEQAKRALAEGRAALRAALQKAA
jgi:hypothetical protein